VPAAPYPVSVTVEPLLTGRNRLTVGLRMLTAIPHIILVGGLGFSAARSGPDQSIVYSREVGILGGVVMLLVVISWFSIVIAAKHFPLVRQFTGFYMRWRVRALAYLLLLADRYPPFGDGAYPAALRIEDPPEPRNRLTVAFRLLLGIPHFVLLALLVTAWWITTVIAWILIMATREYPAALYDFGVGVLRWYTRVEAYMFLMVDEYPPFSFR
jgi:hypothetical protein